MEIKKNIAIEVNDNDKNTCSIDCRFLDNPEGTDYLKCILYSGYTYLECIEEPKWNDGEGYYNRWGNELPKGICLRHRNCIKQHGMGE